jgi:predicted nucleic-acid-binding protein
MRVAVDTNVLVRAVVGDDSSQAQTAAKILEKSELVAISTVALCEFAWVLKSVYGLARQEAFQALTVLVNAENAVVDRPAVEAGLQVMERGGDFADGVIAYEGAWLGGETFLSFDKKAVARVTSLGQSAKLLS